MKALEMQTLKINDLAPLVRFDPPVVHHDDDIDVLLDAAVDQRADSTVYVLDAQDRLIGQVPASRILAYLHPLAGLAGSDEYYWLCQAPRDEAFTAASLMIPASCSLSEHDTVEQAVRVLLSGRLSEVPIVSESGRLLGLLSSRRLIELVRRTRSRSCQPAVESRQLVEKGAVSGI